MNQIIVNEEIELKELSLQDSPALLQLVDANRDYLRKWMCWVDDVRELKDAKIFVDQCSFAISNKRGFTFGVWFKGELIGELGFNSIDNFNKVGVIGYWIGHEFQGRGIISISLKRVLDFGFDYLALNRMEIRVPVNNSRSHKVAERLGFEKEAKLRKWGKFYDDFIDVFLYSKIKGDE